MLPPSRRHNSSCLSVTFAESWPGAGESGRGDRARAASGVALYTLVASAVPGDHLPLTGVTLPLEP